MTLIQKKLKDKIEEIEFKVRIKEKKNRIGKVRINQYNNYTPDKYVSRKTCVRCDNVNHLPTNYKYVQIHMHMPSMSMSVKPAMQPWPDVVNQKCNSMPFIPNPYYSAFNMPWNIPGINVMFASNPNMTSSQVYASDLNTNTFAQRPAPRVKLDLNPPKPKVSKGLKAKGATNKA